MASVSSISIGSAIAMLASSGWTLNVLVMAVIIKGKFLAGNGNATYSMLFNLILSDTLHLSLILFYLTPAAIVQNVMINGLDIILGSTMTVSLYVSRAMLVCLAYSRLAQICYPKFSHFFEREKVVKFCIIIWPICTGLAIIAQYLMPCCQLVLYFGKFSLHYDNQVNSTNYSNLLIEKPTSIGSSVTAFICYSIIIIKVRRERKQIAIALTNSEHQKRKKQEYGFALQFIAISICSTFTWLSFLIYPRIIPADQQEWYAFVALGMISNCSVTSVICASFNKDIQRVLWKIFKCQGHVKNGSNNANNGISLTRGGIKGKLNSNIITQCFEV